MSVNPNKLHVLNENPSGISPSGSATVVTTLCPVKLASPTITSALIPISASSPPHTPTLLSSSPSFSASVLSANPDDKQLRELESRIENLIEILIFCADQLNKIGTNGERIQGLLESLLEDIAAIDNGNDILRTSIGKMERNDKVARRIRIGATVLEAMPVYGPAATTLGQVLTTLLAYKKIKGLDHLLSIIETKEKAESSETKEEGEQEPSVISEESTLKALKALLTSEIRKEGLSHEERVLRGQILINLLETLKENIETTLRSTAERVNELSQAVVSLVEKQEDLKECHNRLKTKGMDVLTHNAKTAKIAGIAATVLHTVPVVGAVAASISLGAGECTLYQPTDLGSPKKSIEKEGSSSSPTSPCVRIPSVDSDSLSHLTAEETSTKVHILDGAKCHLLEDLGGLTAKYNALVVFLHDAKDKVLTALAKQKGLTQAAISHDKLAKFGRWIAVIATLPKLVPLLGPAGSAAIEAGTSVS